MKIALFEPDARSLWWFRKSLITQLHSQGHRVYALCAPDEYTERVESLGAVCFPLAITRYITPVKDLRLCLQLYRLFRRERFDVVHTFTHKPNIFGAIMASLAGCPKVVQSVTGLGVLFTYKTGMGWWLVRKVFYAMSWVSFRVSDRVCFFNRDIRDRILATGIIAREKTVVIRSSGVDIESFAPSCVSPQAVEQLRAELGGTSATRYVLMVSRLIWGKGVAEFIEATELLRGRCPSATFLLVGPLEEDGHQGVPASYIRSKQSDRLLWLGFRDDIKELMALSDLVVLPSYGEGVPRSLLEAMAMAKPIISTDTYGCREVVEHGQNGLMVPVKDARQLADAIETLLKDDLGRQVMGRHSREKAEREFAADIVVRQITRELYGLG